MKIRCLKCNDIIESLSVHDYKKCKCGLCSIDGRNEYKRIDEIVAISIRFLTHK